MNVTGMACLGSFGTGTRDLLSAFAVLPASEFAGDRAARADTTGLTGLLPARSLRQTDHFTRMALLAVLKAVEDAQDEGGSDFSDGETAIVVASGYGPASPTFDFLDSLLEYGETMASPLAFSHSVQNIPAATLAMRLGLTGPCATVCQWDNPVAPALVIARQWLREGRAKRVLFGAVDELTPFLEETSARLSARKAARASGAHTRVPLGEGAVFFCLEDRDKGKCYGEIGRVELGVGHADFPVLPQAVFFASGRVPLEWAALPGAIRALPAYGNIPIAQAFNLAVFFAQAGDFPGGETVCAHFGRDGLADIVRAAGKSCERAACFNPQRNF
ncbi:MAG: beta-ketoacyl synthase chain length factor [Desulfovibrio sp.]|jgi:3-oxoacyl-[acyl-carrier-protein] synthase II|nr:beta-ketoacyl synthase chain length factor [Desulfovibrio sp.]